MTMPALLSVEASAEVIPGTPADRKLAAIKALCREYQTEASGGGYCDVDTIPPGDILAIIEAEDPS